MSSSDLYAQHAAMPASLDVRRLDQMLAPGAPQPREVTFLVEDLITEGAAGLMVGASNNGKTPLLVQMGLAVAHGKPFLGRRTRQTRVLLIDAESLESNYYDYLRTICAFLGVETLSSQFHVYSPTWEKRDIPSPFAMQKIVQQLIDTYQPGFVIMDPLRPLFPGIESEPALAATWWQWQRRLAKDGVTFLTVHHPRKPSKDRGKTVLPNLAEDPHTWMYEAAGSSALTQQADFRLGFDTTVDLEDEDREDHLVMAGFSKSVGRIAPLSIDRIYKDVETKDGIVTKPYGYEPAPNRMWDALKDAEKRLYTELPEHFSREDVRRILDIKGSSSTQKRIERLEKAELCRKIKINGKTSGYKKLTPDWMRRIESRLVREAKGLCLGAVIGAVYRVIAANNWQ